MNDFIQQALARYKITSAQEELNALKEIAQEVILFALSTTSFFNKVYFCGGTCLRIVYKTGRFSEDLDFSTLEPDKHFNFDLYMKDVVQVLESFGLSMHIVKPGRDDGFVRRRALRQDSEKWKISFPHTTALKKVVIKLEVDVNPPCGADTCVHMLDNPIAHQVLCASPDTLLAGKLHAILCRDFMKGRDWYDFIWYVNRGQGVNFDFLQSALCQMGPFKGQTLRVDMKFIHERVSKKIKQQDWQKTAADTMRFVSSMEAQSLNLWSEKFFLHKLDQLCKKNHKPV